MSKFGAKRNKNASNLIKTQYEKKKRQRIKGQRIKAMDWFLALVRGQRQRKYSFPRIVILLASSI